MIYADSSFIVSLYLRDVNFVSAQSWLEEKPCRLCLSRIAEFETSNALRLSLFRGWITENQYQQAATLFHEDMRRLFLTRSAISPEEVFGAAEKLSSRHTIQTGNRSLDILHVASALVAEMNVFASFDRRQRSLAQLCGLKIVPDMCES